jgi:dihydrofolate reductase
MDTFLLPDSRGVAVRSLTAGLFASVDGVVEAPNQWQFDAFDERVGAAMSDMMSRVDTVLLGRVGYQEWSGYWPTVSDDPFAAFINPIPKFVASRTLTGPLEWQNSQLIEGDLADFVRRLKSGDGGDIAIGGGISLVRQLLFAELLDALTLVVHPVVAGAGRHLFEPTDPTTRLKLVDGETTPAGNAILTYTTRRD